MPDNIAKSKTWHFNFRGWKGAFNASFLLYYFLTGVEGIVSDWKGCTVRCGWMWKTSRVLCLLRHIRHFRVKTEQEEVCYTSSNGYGAHTRKLSVLTQIFFIRSHFLFLNYLMCVLSSIMDTKIEKT